MILFAFWNNIYLKQIKAMEIGRSGLVSQIQQTGVIITVVKLVEYKEKAAQPIYFEIKSNQDYYGERSSGLRNISKRTRLVEPDNPVFNDSVHYNTSELIDDNITFILRRRDGSEIGRHTQRNMKFWRRQNIYKKEVDIKDRGQVVATLLIKVDFKQNHDIISGICVPDLSLVPRYPYNPKYNALDGYNPNLKTNRANCFSFFDGDRVPGFDQIDVFPAKFVLPKDMK